MRIMHCLLTLLLAILVAILWLAITEQNTFLAGHGLAEARLIDLLLESRRNGHRLALMARQNEVLTSRTQAILERTRPVVTPAVIPALAPSGVITPYRGPDEPLVLYEAEPAKTPVKKGGRK